VSIAEGALVRALEFQRETTALVAEEFRAIGQGWVVRSRSLPRVWSLNHVRVTEPIEFDEAVALADEHLSELPYRQVLVEHQDSGERVEPAFRGAGWRVERELTMALLSEPDREVDTAAVIEPAESELLAMMDRWTGEDVERVTPEGRRQVVEQNRLAWRARAARRFGILGGGGAMAAMALLYSGGRTAQVEDVYTVPEERGHGFARALVTHAAATARDAGHELTFIVADDDDWPKRLYGRIGFEPLGCVWLFHRELSASDSR
jgi:GNAT superfamily N-acetyltransferase